MIKWVLLFSAACIFSTPLLLAQKFTEESKARGIDHYFKDKVLTGGGAAFFDFDNDGDEDLYLTGGLAVDRLFENDGTGQYKQLPNDIGFAHTLQYNSLGVTTGDIDNDGYRDIFVCTWDYRNDLFGPNLLFKNNGDGTFTDISESAGILESSYSTSATFWDFDKDGFLDIYVVNHVEEVAFLRDSTGKIYGYDHDCFENFLYRNNGDLTFSEMAVDLGLGSVGCGLAAVATDIDFDNDPDLYVANDFGEFVVANELFENGHPTPSFQDISRETGANVGLYGMGIAAGDYDQDLDIDFYITNIGRNILIENKNGLFEDVTTERGVENEKVPEEGLNTTGWGTAFLDVNNDTWLDLFVANGRIPALSVNATAMNDPNKLFLNNGDKTFSDISLEAGVADERLARGFVYADVDQDGDLDMLTVVLRGFEADAHTKLYINQTDQSNNYIQFKLTGTTSNRDAFGAKLWLYAGGKIFLREIYGGGASYASQSSSIVHFGLGSMTEVDSLKIDWPSGHQQVVFNPSVNNRHIVEENVVISTSNRKLSNDIADIQLIPNPFQKALLIKLSGNISKDARVKLFSSDGKRLHTSKIGVNQQEIRIDGSGLPYGLMFLQFEMNGAVATRKVVKLK